ncbi:MAG TPA: hypothetical protein VN436_03700 [Holophaga sp.]|nr:hypothetical protein [Holophaga sp.]
MSETGEVLEGTVVEGQKTILAKRRWLASIAHAQIGTIVKFEDESASEIVYWILEEIAAEAVRDALQRMEALDRRHRDAKREEFQECLDSDGEYFKPDESEHVFDSCFQ